MSSLALIPAPYHLPIPTLWPPLPGQHFQNRCKRAPSPTAGGPGAEFLKPWWPFLPTTPTFLPLQPWHVFTGSYPLDVSLDSSQLDVSPHSSGAPTAHILGNTEALSPVGLGRFLSSQKRVLSRGQEHLLPHTPTLLSLHSDTHLELGGLPTSSSPASCLDVISVLLKRDEEPRGAEPLHSVPSAWCVAEPHRASSPSPRLDPCPLAPNSGPIHCHSLATLEPSVHSLIHRLSSIQMAQP